MTLLKPFKNFKDKIQEEADALAEESYKRAENKKKKNPKVEDKDKNNKKKNDEQKTKKTRKTK